MDLSNSKAFRNTPGSFFYSLCPPEPIFFSPGFYYNKLE
jgi:hypothetical protein